MTRRSQSFRTPRQRKGPTFPEALQQLRAGGVLRLTHTKNGQAWDLDNRPVALEIVVLLTSHNEIRPDDDALFENTAAQSWRIRQ
jgi:hypothetical protein